LVLAGVKDITVADINPANLEKIKKSHPFLKVVDQRDLFALDVDVICPCALGGVIHDDSLAVIKAKVIAGSANNVLLDDRRHGPKAKELGILIAPDFIINAGGLINVYHEHHSDYEEAKVKEEIKRIGLRLTRIYQMAKTKDIDPFLAATQFANQQLK
jgi:leucine dehydrogenase